VKFDQSLIAAALCAATVFGVLSAVTLSAADPYDQSYFDSVGKYVHAL